MAKRILGIVGSYRKNGTIDSLVTEVLTSAEEQGALTEKIYLLDKNIAFCTNCRTCTQKPGTERGLCVHRDDMADILDRYKFSDGIVLGAPVNCFNLNALTRRFMERLVCFTYWPWGQPGYKLRNKVKGKKAVLITSSAMPAFMGRIFTGAPRALRVIAETMGARPVAILFSGLSAQKEEPVISDKMIRRAREAGRKLAAP
ncbi:MAG TPA: flavodoxin family protein [Nitrospirota bacterium]|nr:flavodoxin family protein [Nitrospirota bacterium]